MAVVAATKTCIPRMSPSLAGYSPLAPTLAAFPPFAFSFSFRLVPTFRMSSLATQLVQLLLQVLDFLFLLP